MLLKFDTDRERLHTGTPLFFDWLHLANYFCCSGKKRKAYRAFRDLTNTSTISVGRDLDLIRFIRAKRLHGFGLSLLMNSTILKNSAALAYTRPIKEC
jgi:hypothetical protein